MIEESCLSRSDFFFKKGKLGPLIFNLSILVILFILSICSVGAQVIKGELKDSLSAEIIIGYNVVLRDIKGNFISGTNGDNQGKFAIAYPKINQFSLEFSHVAYKTKNIAVNKETVAPFYEIFLQSDNSILEGLEIKSSPYHYFNLNKLGEISITAEHPGMAASFDDPSRSVLRIPGVGTSNDQANTISYHGLPNEMINWKLDGAEILNPNHLSNAGTTSNRPSSNAGGVLAIPFEVLDEYKFYPAPFAKAHGNAIAGISDIIPRKKLPERLGYAKLGLLGMEAGFSKKFTEITGVQALYRYSFTGLLNDFGVSFDGESIRYQDAFLRLHFIDTEDKGVYFTTIFGHSKNEKSDSNETVDTEGYLGSLGITYFENFSSTAKINSSVFLSGKRDNGFSAINNQDVQNFSNTSIIEDEQFKISSFTEFSFKSKESLTQLISLSISHWDYKFLYFESNLVETSQGLNDQFRSLANSENSFQYGNIGYALEIAANNWKIKPEFSLALTPQKNFLLEPGFNIIRNSPKTRFSFGSNFSNQNQEASIYALNEAENIGFGFPFSIGDQRELENSRAINSYASFFFRFSQEIRQELTAKIFYHNLFNLAIPDEAEKYFPYTGVDFLRADKLRNEGNANSKGVELMYSHELSEDFHLVINGSLFDSKYLTTKDGSYASAPNNYGFTSNLLATKKYSLGSGSLFISFASHFRGGAYVPEVNLEVSKERLRTAYTSNFTQLSNYYRLDTRLNYTFKKKNQIILDIQNLTNKLNDGYYFYDQVNDEIKLEKQLGLIPVFSYRREF